LRFVPRVGFRFREKSREGRKKLAQRGTGVPQRAPPGREAPRKKKGRALGWWKRWEFAMRDQEAP